MSLPKRQKLSKSNKKSTKVSKKTGNGNQLKPESQQLVCNIPSCIRHFNNRLSLSQIHPEVLASSSALAAEGAVEGQTFHSGEVC
jgi:hypothetical protein